MPRTSRLRSGRQHGAVRLKGVTFHGSLLRLGVLENQAGPTIGAAVVSRRVGSAVVRNTVKRRLKEIFRHELPSLKPGLWIVTTAKPAAAKATLADLRSEWLRLGARLSIFADS